MYFPIFGNNQANIQITIELKDLNIKLREVFFPYLIVVLGTIVLYGLFRWILEVQLDVLPFDSNLLDYFIPLALPCIPVFLWMTKRIRVLKLTEDIKNLHSLYQFVMVFSIGITTIFSQGLITKGSYRLTDLNQVEKTRDYSKEKYFRFKSYEVNKKSQLRYARQALTGQKSESLKFLLLFACQFEGAEDIWYGVKYKESVDNDLTKGQKERAYRKFLNESDLAYRSFEFKNARYFEKLRHYEDKQYFLKVIRENFPGDFDKEPIILIPQLEEFDQRMGGAITGFFWSLGIGSLILFIMIYNPEIDTQALQELKEGRKNNQDEAFSKFAKVLDPRGLYKVTAILLLLNLTVFIVFLFGGHGIEGPGARELLEYGGNRRFEVMNGDYWRLFTYMFLHGGLMHLVSNLFGLVISGYFLERILGRTRMLLSYVVCGTVAGLVSIYWHDFTVSVGASGAIFGLLGIIFALNFFKVYSALDRDMIWTLLGAYGGISLLLGFTQGIDNAAHIGGLVCGLVLGTVFTFLDEEGLKKRASSP